MLFVGRPYLQSFQNHAAASILTLLGGWAALLDRWAALLGRWAALLGSWAPLLGSWAVLAAVAACLQWLSHTLPSQTTISLLSGRLIMPSAHTSSYCVHQLWHCQSCFATVADDCSRSSAVQVRKPEIPAWQL